MSQPTAIPTIPEYLISREFRDRPRMSQPTAIPTIPEYLVSREFRDRPRMSQPTAIPTIPEYWESWDRPRMSPLQLYLQSLNTLGLQLFAGTFFCGFVLFYVSLVLNFAIFKSVNIILF